MFESKSLQKDYSLFRIQIEVSELCTLEVPLAACTRAFSSPNIVWAFVPAVSAASENAAFTFRLAENLGSLHVLPRSSSQPR